MRTHGSAKNCGVEPSVAVTLPAVGTSVAVAPVALKSQACTVTSPDAANAKVAVADSPLAVPEALIRLSVGIESARDLVADLRQAIDEA